MFTGIVDHCGSLLESRSLNQGKKIWISTAFSALQLGESLSVDGICLTVVDTDPKAIALELSPETLALTSAKYWTSGKALNLERALRMGDLLGGHFVTGHVDQTGVLEKRIEQTEFSVFQFSGVLPDQQNLLIKKGSIAVNGVSLTLNSVWEDGFQVTLIPHTLQRTNLGLLQPGDPVNLEFDYLARIVASQVRKGST